MPVVSIIIPVHNREHILSHALDSVKAQTFPDWECIIVDDHSTDGTFAVANQYAKSDERFRPVHAPENKRYANAARNYGLVEANGNYVNFLDSDDSLVSDKLQIQLEAFQREPNLDMISCQHDILYQQNASQEKLLLRFADQQYWLDVIWFPDYRKRYGGLWCTNAPLWRRRTIISLGAWDEELMAWHDDDLNIRALLNGVRIKRLEKILVHVRKIGTENVNTPSFTKNTHILMGLKKSWSLLKEKEEDTNLRRRMIALNIMEQARWLLKQNHLIAGLRYWQEGASFIDESPLRVLQGYLILLSFQYSFLRPVYYRLRPNFYRHVNLFPNALLGST